jgi:predicted YcjX-like family ATPase
MADTAGLKQDQQNFKYTLRYISTLEELHGIAIVMDAKTVRLTAAFRYCIGQLLTHLHRDAAKNIVFVFTKCGHEKNPGKSRIDLFRRLVSRHIFVISSFGIPTLCVPPFS